MRRDGERRHAVEVRELGIAMGSLAGMSSSKRKVVLPLANVRIIEAVGIVSHEVVVSTATPDAWIAVFCVVAKGVDFTAHRDAIKKEVANAAEEGALPQVEAGGVFRKLEFQA